MAADVAMTARANAVDHRSGAFLKERREALALTRADVAVALSTTVERVANVERGAMRLTAGEIHLLSRRLGVRPGFFLRDPDPLRGR